MPSVEFNEKVILKLHILSNIVKFLTATFETWQEHEVHCGKRANLGNILNVVKNNIKDQRIYLFLYWRPKNQIRIQIIFLFKRCWVIFAT